jgi:lysophospholipase L1-like esterase
VASPVWVGSWAASQQVPEPQNALSPDDLRDATVRQIVHLTLAGSTVRVHISNAFGIAPLHFTSVHIARPLSAAASKIDPASDRALSFSGSSDVTVPAGAEYISDPIDYPVTALSNLAITYYLETPPVQQTSHPGSRSTTYFTHGNLVSAVDLPDAKKIDHWYLISGVDVTTTPNSFSIVTLGDSITDGHAATTNGNDRWPDVLAQRLQAAPETRAISVLNHGIGGNHLLIDGLGPNALARFDRDVLAQPGIRFVILLEGINDLGGLSKKGEAPPAEHDLLVHRMLSSYEQIVTRAHSHGIYVIGATILPDGGSKYYHPGSSDEADRQKINQWIRAAGHFDAVVDFDKVVMDPNHQDQILPAYDSGDHLHPSPAGYRAMGEAIPLSLFTH